MDERSAQRLGPNTPGGVAEDANAYQMTLASLVLPVPLHCAFNAVAALTLGLLGHPIVGAANFIASCAVDRAFQRTIARWTRVSDTVEENLGFSRLALFCAVRALIYLSGPFFLSFGGGTTEIAYLGLTAAMMLVIAGSSGGLSRKIFWAFAAPAMAALATSSIVNFPPQVAAGMILSLVSLAVLLVMVSHATTTAITGWHGAYMANLAMIPELEAARDQAVEERAAADEAREEARRANAAKSIFLATMSHEIRTPMNGVLGMAQLLRREEGDPRQVDRLQTLIESGEHLLSILNDILDVSKIDAGRLEISPQAEDLPKFLERAVAFWRPRADETGVGLSLAIDGELPHFIWMDPVRVRQVLFNLIGNALKFAEGGAVTIRVAAQPHGESAAMVRFAVADTGPGIPAERLPALFDRFSQVDELENRKYGGTGLGLAIVKQLTELMGGHVWVESEFGHGATFYVEAPFDLAQGAGQTDAEEVAGDAPVGPLDVLIVDDNPINLLVLEQVLSAFGHRVERATDGQAALDLLARRPVDLVLMDIQMPGMTGVEALQRLRAAPGPNRCAPVVALTADVTSGGRAHYLGLGFTEHSSKPIQIPDLMSAIGRAMAAGVEATRLEG